MFWWRAIRLFARLAVRAYYSAFRVEGLERIPGRGGILFVVNHPNALVDAAAVLAALPRPVRFGAKSTLFGVPVLGWMLRKLGAVPVHRPRDGTGGVRRNLKMFEHFVAHLKRGGTAVIFPEGHSHTAPQLRDVKSGPARIALDTAAAADWDLDFAVVPVGLQFEPAQEFRGECVVRIGEPFGVTDLKDASRRDAIRTVQGRIRDSLRQLMLHLERVDTEPLVRRVAEVYDEHRRAAAGRTGPRSRADVVKVAGACLNHYLAADPSAVEATQRKLRLYERLSARARVGSEILAGKARPVRAWLAFVRLLVGLVLGFPFFLAGCLVGYFPYRASDLVAQRLIRLPNAGRVTLPLARIAAGALLFGLFWGALSVGVFLWSSSLLIAIGFLGGMVATGLYARFYAGRARTWRAQLVALLPLVARRQAVRRVGEAREDLIGFVGELVRRYQEETDSPLLEARAPKLRHRLPWRRALLALLMAAAVWFLWGLRDPELEALAAPPSPWGQLDGAARRPRVARDARALVATFETLERLEKKMKELDSDFATGRRVPTDPEDDAQVRQALLTYLNCRTVLFRLVWYYRDADEGEAFLLGYAAAVELCARGMQLVSTFSGSPDAKRKLNEPDAALDLPAGTYDRVRANLASVEVLDALAAATARFRQVRATFPGDAPWPDIVGKAETGAAVAGRLASSLWKYKWDRAVARPLQWWGEGFYRVSSLVSTWIGNTRLRQRRHSHGLIRPDQVERVRALLKPGDIIIERRNWYLSNAFLPGFWPHSALYLGDGLEMAGLEDDPRVAPHLQALAAPDDQGRRRVVLEAVSEGVIFSSLEESVGGADAICILRPRLVQADIAEALARGVQHHGKPYDFDFDFFSTDRLVCTEVVFRAYQGLLDFELETILGRKTLPALEIVRKWADQRGTPAAQLELVLFLDAVEEDGAAREADASVLLETLDRPALTLLQAHGEGAAFPRTVLIVLLALLVCGLVFLRPRWRRGRT